MPGHRRHLLSQCDTVILQSVSLTLLTQALTVSPISNPLEISGTTSVSWVRRELSVGAGVSCVSLAPA